MNARSFQVPGARFVTLAGAMLLCCGPCAAATEAPADDSFRWSADVLDSSFRSDTLELLGNVRVAQGDMSIEAEQATADAFRSENSRWQFENSVRVQTAEANLASQSAAASFRDNQLVQARVEGSPAQFEQRGGAPDRSVKGRARVIEYDVTQDVVTLTGDVWFSYGQDEFRGDTVIYNMRDERVRVNPDGDSSGRVKGIIRPRSSSTSSGSSPRATTLEASGEGAASERRRVADEHGA
jgi:lipopolysaccharide transport protein LptA